MKPQDNKSLQMISVRWWNANAWYAVSRAEALMQGGYHTMVCGRRDSPPLQKAQDLQLPRFEELHLESNNPLRARRNLRRLLHLINRERIRVLDAHRSEDVLFAALARRRLGSRIAVVRSVSDARAPKNNPINRYLHHHLVSRLIFSCRAGLERYCSVWPELRPYCTVVYSAIDTDRFTPLPPSSGLRRQYGIPENAPVAGLIARLSPVKDHRSFLQAAALVLQTVGDARFLISGEAFELQHSELEAECKRLGIREKVILLDRAGDVRELIGLLDVGVVCSTGSEVVCRIAVEYMAMGKPLVVTRVNVLPEIVENGKNGLVVSAGNPQELAAAITRLFSDAGLRRQMGVYSRTLAENRFSYTVFREQSLAVYTSALAATATGEEHGKN